MGGGSADPTPAGMGGTREGGRWPDGENGKAAEATGEATSADAWKIPLRVKLLLGIGEAVQGMYITIGGYYLNSFLLETACIDPVYVGAMQAIQGVFDAVNDPFIGNMSDRTRTRWGRRRPWLLFGAPWLAAFYVGLWSALPKAVPQFGKFFFGLAMYMGVSVGITAIQVQIGALVPELTDNYDERTAVSGWRILVMAIMGLLSTLGHGQIVSMFAGDPALGYRVSAIIVGILMWFFAWTVFGGIKENFVAKQESKVKLPLISSVCSIWRNKSFLCVTGVYLCGPSAVVTIQSNFYMFSKYILKDPEVLTILMLCAQGLGMLFLPVWVLLSTRFDKRQVYMVGGSGFMIAMCAIFFVQTREQAILVACFCGLNIGVVYLIPYSMLPDVVDEDELRTGKRREGIYAGFFTTALKLSSTLALTFMNLLLKWFGYSPPQTTCGADLEEDTGDGMGETQSAEVLLCIRLLCSFVPGAYMLFAVFCAWLFPITRQKQAAMAKLAAQRRLERELAMSAQASTAMSADNDEVRTHVSDVPSIDEVPPRAGDGMLLCDDAVTRYVPGCVGERHVESPTGQDSRKICWDEPQILK